MPGEVIFEFQFMAHAVKVSAIDADTGTEIAIMGPRSANQRELEAIAKAKLVWVMAKARAGSKGGEGTRI